MNIFYIIVGIFVALFGVAAFFLPNLTRWIRAPGGSGLKPIIAVIGGVIVIIIGWIV